VKDVIDDAKANPKKITIGGSAIGGADSLCTTCSEGAGIQLNYIVFNSGAKSMRAFWASYQPHGRQPRRSLELYKPARSYPGVYAEKRLDGAPTSSR